MLPKDNISTSAQRGKSLITYFSFMCFIKTSSDLSFSFFTLFINTLYKLEFFLIICVLEICHSPNNQMVQIFQYEYERFEL